MALAQGWGSGWSWLCQSWVGSGVGTRTGLCLVVVLCLALPPQLVCCLEPSGGWGCIHLARDYPPVSSSVPLRGWVSVCVRRWQCISCFHPGMPHDLAFLRNQGLPPMFPPRRTWHPAPHRAFGYSLSSSFVVWQLLLFAQSKSRAHLFSEIASVRGAPQDRTGTVRSVHTLSIALRVALSTAGYSGSEDTAASPEHWMAWS